ncbi:MAG: hypothetical protein WC780_00425 [Lentimicrobiaceae bacterium]
MKKPEITKTCSFCKDLFTASRPTAKFCSNSCRTKANTQRRENEKIEAEKAAEQAIIDKEKRKAAETRKTKKAQKEADLVATKRLADIEREIQAEIDAYESAVKARGINSIVSMLQINAEAKEKQLQEVEERKKKEQKIKHYKEMKEARERGDLIRKGLVEIFTALSKTDNETGNASKNPNLSVPFTHPQKQVNLLPTIDPHPNNAELKSIDPPIPGSLNGPFSANKPGMSSTIGKGTPNPSRNEPIIKTIAEDILDALNIF